MTTPSGSQPAQPGTLQVWSDITCPWATLFVERLWTARSTLGLELDVRFDHHAYALEVVNGAPMPEDILDVEAQELLTLEPSLGWQPWQLAPDAWPRSFLPALAAVQAAKLDGVGGLAESERLDLLLRRALFNESRSIDSREEIVAIARAVDGVNIEAFTAALDDGTADAAVQRDLARAEHIEASPQVFLPDGTTVVNPGITLPEAQDDPLVEDPSVIEELLRRAISPQG